MAPFMSRSPSSLKPTTLQHFTHPIHPLQLLHIPHEFLCNGCSALGFGTRYRCEKCDFDIHEHCATCPITSPSPLHPHHPLTLVNQPGNDKFCDLCGDLVNGLFYTCRTCEFDVHPICTQLPLHVQLPSHPHHLLKLQPAAPAGCVRCFKSCTFWRYKCDICNLDIHLECALGETEQVSDQNIPTCQSRTIVPPTQPTPAPPPFGGFTPGIQVGSGDHGPHRMPGDQVSLNIPLTPYQTPTIVPPIQQPPAPPPFGGFTSGIPAGLGGHGPHGMPGDQVSLNMPLPPCQTRTIVPPTQSPPLDGFTPGVPVGLGGHGPLGIPGDQVSHNMPMCQTRTIVPPTQPPPLGGFTPGIPVGLGGHGPHGMPGGIMMNQAYDNSIGNGYGPHGMPGIMSQPYSNGIGNYGPQGNMPGGIMSQPYYCNWNGYGPDQVNQQNKIQVAGQTSNGKKKRKIYSMVGRLAASAVISSVTGFPIRF